MRRSLGTASTRAVAVAACLLCSTVARADHKPGHNPSGGGPNGPTYDIISFAPFGLTSTKSFVGDLNEMGTMAVGGAELPSGQWRAAHLDIASGVYTTFADGVDLLGINNHNQMVGTVTGMGRFWDGLSATPVELPPLAGDTVTQGFSINDAGIVIGRSGDTLSGPDDGVGVVWRVTKESQNAIVVDGPLALPTTLPVARGHRINELVDGSALVVGEVGETVREAVVWTIEVDQDGMLLQPSLPQGLGTPSWSSGSTGLGINNDGDAVGWSGTHSWPLQVPFFAAAGEAMEQLPLTRKARYGMARDINDADEIVGSINILPKGATGGMGFDHAALWKEGEPTLLESLIDRHSDWERLTVANDIADNGVIKGYGRYDVQRRGFLMAPASASVLPVPEPATAPLLASGAVMLAIRRGRRAFLYQRATSWIHLAQRRRNP